jgi:hypothetical protein
MGFDIWKDLIQNIQFYNSISDYTNGNPTAEYNLIYDGSLCLSTDPSIILTESRFTDVHANHYYKITLNSKALEDDDFQNSNGDAVGLFEGDTKLLHINSGEINTSNLRTCENMFKGCSNLRYVDFRTFDSTTGTAISNMSGMFQDCSNVSVIVVSNQFSIPSTNTSMISGTPTPLNILINKDYINTYNQDFNPDTGKEVRLIGYATVPEIGISFSYHDVDGATNNTTFTYRVEIAPVNDTPTVRDTLPTLSTNEDTEIHINLNDFFTDVENPLGLEYNLKPNSNPLHGRAVISGQILTYTPDENYYGDDTIDISAVDPDDESKTVRHSIPITVNHVNDGPILLRTSYDISCNEGGSFSINVLPDISDVDQQDVSGLTADGFNSIYAIDICATTLLHGTINQDDLRRGVITYTHDDSENFSETITYNIRQHTYNNEALTQENQLVTEAAIINVTIHPIDEVQHQNIVIGKTIRLNQYVEISNNEFASIMTEIRQSHKELNDRLYLRLLTGLESENGETLEYDVHDESGYQPFTENSNVEVDFYTSGVSFRYKATNGTVHTTRTIRISVNDVDDNTESDDPIVRSNTITFNLLRVAATPVALNHELTCLEGGTIAFKVGELHNSVYTYKIIASPTNGEATLDYVDNLQQSHSDYIEYIHDGSEKLEESQTITYNIKYQYTDTINDISINESSTGSATIVIVPVNDNPSFDNLDGVELTCDEGGTVTHGFTFSDADNNLFNYTIGPQSPSMDSSFNITSGGLLTYTHDGSDYLTRDTFNINVYNVDVPQTEENRLATIPIIITINPILDPSTINDIEFNVPINETVTLELPKQTHDDNLGQLYSGSINVGDETSINTIYQIRIPNPDSFKGTVELSNNNIIYTSILNNKATYTENLQYRDITQFTDVYDSDINEVGWKTITLNTRFPVISDNVHYQPKQGVTSVFELPIQYPNKSGIIQIMKQVDYSTSPIEIDVENNTFTYSHNQLLPYSESNIDSFQFKYKNDELNIDDATIYTVHLEVSKNEAIYNAELQLDRTYYLLNEAREFTVYSSTTTQENFKIQITQLPTHGTLRVSKNGENIQEGYIYEYSTIMDGVKLYYYNTDTRYYSDTFKYKIMESIGENGGYRSEEKTFTMVRIDESRIPSISSLSLSVLEHSENNTLYIPIPTTSNYAYNFEYYLIVPSVRKGTFVNTELVENVKFGYKEFQESGRIYKVTPVNGYISYTPNDNLVIEKDSNVSEVYNYFVIDKNLYGTQPMSNISSISVTINEINVKPELVAIDPIELLELGTTDNTIDLLEGASDPDNDEPLEIVIVEEPMYGTITRNGSRISYRNTIANVGNDRIVYYAIDNRKLASDTYTLEFIIQNQPDKVIAYNMTASVVQTNRVEITLETLENNPPGSGDKTMYLLTDKPNNAVIQSISTNHQSDDTTLNNISIGKTFSIDSTNMTPGQYYFKFKALPLDSNGVPYLDLSSNEATIELTVNKNYILPVAKSGLETTVVEMNESNMLSFAVEAFDIDAINTITYEIDESRTALQYGIVKESDIGNTFTYESNVYISNDVEDIIYYRVNDGQGNVSEWVPYTIKVTNDKLIPLTQDITISAYHTDNSKEITLPAEIREPNGAQIYLLQNDKTNNNNNILIQNKFQLPDLPQGVTHNGYMRVSKTFFIKPSDVRFPIDQTFTYNYKVYDYIHNLTSDVKTLSVTINRKFVEPTIIQNPIVFNIQEGSQGTLDIYPYVEYHGLDDEYTYSLSHEGSHSVSSETDISNSLLKYKHNGTNNFSDTVLVELHNNTEGKTYTITVNMVIGNVIDPPIFNNGNDLQIDVDYNKGGIINLKDFVTPGESGNISYRFDADMVYHQSNVVDSGPYYTYRYGIVNVILEKSTGIARITLDNVNKDIIGSEYTGKFKIAQYINNVLYNSDSSVGSGVVTLTFKEFATEAPIITSTYSPSETMPVSILEASASDTTTYTFTPQVSLDPAFNYELISTKSPLYGTVTYNNNVSHPTITYKPTADKYGIERFKFSAQLIHQNTDGTITKIFPEVGELISAPKEVSFTIRQDYDDLGSNEVLEVFDTDVTIKRLFSEKIYLSISNPRGRVTNISVISQKDASVGSFTIYKDVIKYNGLSMGNDVLTVKVENDLGEEATASIRIDVVHTSLARAYTGFHPTFRQIAYRSYDAIVNDPHLQFFDFYNIKRKLTY